MTENISAWQNQATVTDTLHRPLRDLRISVIDRCNFRCPYCMPADIYGEQHHFMPRTNWLTPGEIKRLAGLFQQLGVQKFRLTGGEPLLRKDITDIVAALAELTNAADDFALTTNGSRLEALAQPLRDAGLKRITVSLDSLDDATFQQMNGQRGDLAKVLAGIDAAVAAGFAPIKINCTVLRGRNETGALDLVEHFRGTDIIVRFIEFMDVGTMNDWRPQDVVRSTELLERIAARWPVEAVESRYRGEVAKRYRYVDGQGEIGFVSSVSEPFCGDCNRIRLAADGSLYTCLFAAGGTPLREILRAGASDAELIGLLQNIWRGRADRYSELRNEQRTHQAKRRIEMYRMGG